MKSPSKKRIIRPCPNELERKVQEQRRKNRLDRLAQVRRQTQIAALQTLKKNREISSNVVRKIGNEELSKYRERMSVELAALEAEYVGCLSDMGLGYEGVRKDILEKEFKKKKRIQENEIAEIRGVDAGRKLNYMRDIKEKMESNKKELRKSAVLVEKLRAAKLRKANAKVILTEYPTGKTKTCPKHLYYDEEDKENISVKKIHSNKDEGRKQALKEIQLGKKENPNNMKSLKELEDIRMRSEKRIEEAKAEYLQLYRDSITYPNDVEENNKRFWESDDLDTIPTRDESSSIGSTPPLKARITRTKLDFTPPSTSREMSTEEDSTPPESMSKTSSKVIQTDKIDGTGTGFKNFQSDRNFIAKVLNLRPNQVQLENENNQNTGVRINIVEESSSSSSNDLINEKFLTSFDHLHDTINQFKTQKHPNKELRNYIEKLLAMKRDEIDELSSVTITSETSSSSSFRNNNNSSSILEADNSSSFQASTPNSNEGSSKTTSILSTSSSSSSRNSSKKSVSFNPADISYKKRKKEIFKHTRENLNQLRESIREEEIKIQKQLEKSLIKKIVGKNNSNISEGPLSTSSGSLSGKSSLISSNDSIMNLKITSTSSSKIQELKSKIYEMKIPVLPKPDMMTTTTMTFTTDDKIFSSSNSSTSSPSSDIRISSFQFTDDDSDSIRTDHPDISHITLSDDEEDNKKN